MSIERVTEYFKQFGRENDILQFPVSSATVALAAEALHCAPALIAKTLSFKGPEGPILIVMTGDRKLDNKKYKQVFHTKAVMLHGDEVEELVGHAIGGVCPFAIQEGVKVYLDEGIKQFEYVYPACGSANSAIKLTPDELFQYSHAESYVDVSKELEPVAANAPAA